MTDSFEDRTSIPEPQGDGALLTAFLFGELSSTEAEQLELRLDAEPELRTQLQALEETLQVVQEVARVDAPTQLGADARGALRAAAAQHQGATTSGATGATGGALLAFPWLRAAAAVLVVAGGYSLYQAGDWSTDVSSARLGGSTEASAPEWNEDSRADGKNDLKRRSGFTARLGYANKDESERSLEDRRESEDASPALQALGYLDGGSSDSSLGRGVDAANEPRQSESRGAVALRPQTADLGGGGGTYKGPGDSVPPPSAAVDPEAVLFGGPPDGEADRYTEFSGARIDKKWKPENEEASPERAEVERLRLGSELDVQADLGFDAGLYATEQLQTLQEQAGWLGDQGSFELNFELPLRQLGYTDREVARERSAASRGYDEGLADGQIDEIRRVQADQLILHIRPVSEEEDPSDMFFRYYGDNAFVDASREQLSTFAIDVDTASYPLARNYLASGQLPPRAAVRTEEVVNYFAHDLVAPQNQMFTVDFSCAPTPFVASSNHVLMKVGVKAQEVSMQERMPMNLVFVVDKSGSMREGGRMDLVKRSLELVLDQLRDDDKVGIVSFDREGHIVQETIEARERWRVRESLRNLEPGGSTNAGEGLFLGYEMLDRNFIEGGINRVVLASDGVANTGETDQQRILQQVEDFTTRSVDLTTVGVGMGNHNDVFLEQLANQGNGSCHYVDSMEEARRVFLDEFASTMQTVARDVKIQVDFDPAQVKQWRQLGYENRSLTKEQFRDDTVDAGEVGAGHEIVALYELELVDGEDLDLDGARPLANVHLRWKPDMALLLWASNAQTGLSAKDGQRVMEQSWGLSRESVYSSWNEAPARFRLAAVAAQFAEYLRRSYHVRGDDYALLERNSDLLARELDADASVRELRDLIRSTRSLVQRNGSQDELWQLIEEGRRLAMLQQELRQAESEDDQTRELMVELIERNSELEQRIRDYLEQRD